MSTSSPVQNHEPAEEPKREEVMKEEEKEAKSEEPTEERSEQKEQKEEKNDQGKKEKKKEKIMKEEDLQGSWKDFFYNSRTGELLGRTASSWGKMSVSRFRSDWSGFNLNSTEPSWVIRRKFNLRSYW